MLRMGRPDAAKVEEAARIKKAIRFVRGQLNEMGLDPGTEDGVLGPRALAALDRVEGIPWGC